MSRHDFKCRGGMLHCQEKFQCQRFPRDGVREREATYCPSCPLCPSSKSRCRQPCCTPRYRGLNEHIAKLRSEGIEVDDDNEPLDNGDGTPPPIDGPIRHSFIKLSRQRTARVAPSTSRTIVESGAIIDGIRSLITPISNSSGWHFLRSTFLSPCCSP